MVIFRQPRCNQSFSLGNPVLSEIRREYLERLIFNGFKAYFKTSLKIVSKREIKGNLNIPNL